jgi:hypothetical protein
VTYHSGASGEVETEHCIQELRAGPLWSAATGLTDICLGGTSAHNQKAIRCLRASGDLEKTGASHLPLSHSLAMEVGRSVLLSGSKGQGGCSSSVGLLTAP